MLTLQVIKLPLNSFGTLYIPLFFLFLSFLLARGALRVFARVRPNICSGASGRRSGKSSLTNAANLARRRFPASIAILMNYGAP